MLVSDEERVVRLCFKAGACGVLGLNRPRHVDEKTGLIYEDAVQMQDLMQRGFSLQRLKLYTLAQAEDAEQRLQDKHQGMQVELVGGVAAIVARVHGIVDDNGMRVFDVEVHPTEQDPSHAMVKSAHPRSQLLKFRPRLVECFDPVQPIAQLCCGQIE